MAGNRVRRLPRQVLDMVNRLLEEGRTIDEVTSALRAVGSDVSRSSALFQCMSSLRAMATEDPTKAVDLIRKAATAQMLLSRARRDDAETTIKADDYAGKKQMVFETTQTDNVFTVNFVGKEKDA